MHLKFFKIFKNKKKRREREIQDVYVFSFIIFSHINFYTISYRVCMDTEYLLNLNYICCCCVFFLLLL